MFKKIIFTVSFVIISFCGTAQKNLNDYKYIIIPKSFEFSKSELPEDLAKNRCLGLLADVSNDEGGMFKTKLEILLKDCYDTVVMASEIGESRKKEFDKAYVESLRRAFVTFQNLDYKYVEQKVVVETPKEENQPVNESSKTKEKEEIALVEDKVKAKEVKTELPKVITTELYYAQAISNGFQIVNSEPKVVMVLLTTSAKDVFIVKNGNAIVYKKDNKWLYSENNGTTTSEKEVNIKF